MRSLYCPWISPTILTGALNSRSVGWLRKISRAVEQIIWISVFLRQIALVRLPEYPASNSRWIRSSMSRVTDSCVDANSTGLDEPDLKDVDSGDGCGSGISIDCDWLGTAEANDEDEFTLKIGDLGATDNMLGGTSIDRLFMSADSSFMLFVEFRLLITGDDETVLKLAFSLTDRRDRIERPLLTDVDVSVLENCGFFDFDGSLPIIIV
ncbi:hypothetical protein OGAPHI_005853 [Ogataea philodendri]|uniref:Uncharacterized protein n=1 Tax=Ogataea philodendri TaxID=1378263 RepID=A0A9P8T2C9_9ASCO|nr:uncharacterized protein OGAPHI_005853 [Ogataea philodendri]KAH3662601.1 hypothetical protein OGAPHI_005853 [Ogataea philodendri]